MNITGAVKVLLWSGLLIGFGNNGANASSDSPAAPTAPLKADEATISQATTSQAATSQTTISQAALKAGIELYAGRSNLQGLRRYTDGMWAGYGIFYPSVIYGQWENGEGAVTKLSAGIGELYNTPDDEFYQPVEAWHQRPLGKSGRLNVTAGKFYVPLGLQEWEYETKPGVMLSWDKQPYNAVGAVTYNKFLKTTNSYFRAARQIGKSANVGVSLALGEGLTFNSPHNRAIGLDGVFTRGHWQISTEYLEFRRGSKGRLYSLWGRLSYEKWEKWKPYLSRYVWKDDTGSQGSFRSTVVGLNYQLTPELAVEGAYARTGDPKHVGWIQLHWLWETDFKAVKLDE